MTRPDWFDERPDVTPEREQRLADWIVGYLETQREAWVSTGQTDGMPREELRDALLCVAASLSVPEREEWMPFAEAYGRMFSAVMDVPTGEPTTPEETVDTRDALRTWQSATPAERISLIAHMTGMSEAQVAEAQNYSLERITPARTALYRYFDKAGQLLYVGISGNPTARDDQHRRSSSWHKLTADRTVEWFKTRSEAEKAERTAIATEDPVFNLAHARDKARAIDYLLTRVTAGVSA